MSRSVRTVAISVLILLSGAWRAFSAWVVIEVPMLPHWVGSIELRDINDSGVACGMGNYVINTSSTAFRFNGTTVTELPHLTPADPITLVTGINNHGVICGYSHNAAGDSQAVYWVGTTLYTIPYPPDANPDADFRAYDINDAGVIVGYFWTPAGERAAFYYQDGVTYSLDATIRAAGLGGTQGANAVNNANVICGSARDLLGVETAWVYDINSGVLTVIGRIGTDHCGANDVNLAGQTIGRAKQTAWDIYRAVTFDGTWQVVDSTVNQVQWGRGINDRGRMVGYANTSANRWSWYSDGPGAGSIRAVTLPGWSRLSIEAINNDDWMVAYGVTASSGTDTRACIIRPPIGDADHDGDIDTADFQMLASCLSGPADGPGAPPSASCAKAFDFEPADGCIDLADCARFQLAFEGS
jgi:probable HAF family extracellular repeat protein